MSKRLKQVLAKLCEGMTQVEVAKELKISQPAVSQTLKRLKVCPHCNKPLW